VLNLARSCNLASIGYSFGKPCFFVTRPTRWPWTKLASRMILMQLNLNVRVRNFPLPNESCSLPYLTYLRQLIVRNIANIAIKRKTLFTGSNSKTFWTHQSNVTVVITLALILWSNVQVPAWSDFIHRGSILGGDGVKQVRCHDGIAVACVVSDCVGCASIAPLLYAVCKCDEDCIPHRT